MLRLDGDSGNSLAELSEVCVRDGLEGLHFGLKKPLRLFWPGVDGAGACVAIDFVRFIEAVGADSFLLRVIPLVVFVSSVTWTDDMLFSSDIVGDCDSFSWNDVVRSRVIDTVLNLCTGLRANISLMFLLLSNSGINRPDIGRRYLVEYSCWRSPF